MGDPVKAVGRLRGANRLTHVVDRPRVALHFDGDGAGDDIVVFTGTAFQTTSHRHTRTPLTSPSTGASLLKASSSVEEFG